MSFEPSADTAGASGARLPWRPQRTNLTGTWQAEGFPTLELAEAWADRACGPACVQAVLEWADGRPSRLYDILTEALNLGAYGPKGWIHDRLAALVRGRGIACRARPFSTSLEDWTTSLSSGAAFIASVALGYPSSGARGGHLVFVHLASTIDGQPGFSIMDPADYGAKVSWIEASRFFASFSGRVLLIERE